MSEICVLGSSTLFVAAATLEYIDKDSQALCHLRIETESDTKSTALDVVFLSDWV